jgi:hypothetical protein
LKSSRHITPPAGRWRAANIVAMMLDDDLQHLLTFNGADVQRFAPLIMIDPFP